MRIEKVLSIMFPSVFVLFFLLAVMNYDGYDPFKNYLSDLGIGQKSAIFFNTGLMLTGFIGVAISYRLSQKQNEKKALTMAKALFFLANLSLIGVGIFPENNGLHVLVSGAFFILYAITCPILSYSKPTSQIIKLLGFGVLLSASGFIVFDSIAIPSTILEHITVLMIGLWVVSFVWLGTNGLGKKA